MKTARQAERLAKQLFRFCIVDGNLDESRVRLTIEQVLASRRRGYIVLLARFKRLLKAELARKAARIESAVPLANDLRTRVEASLVQIYGSGLDWSFTQNPALIGGMRIQVGSDVYDGSVRYALTRLARTLGVANGSNVIA